MKQCKLFMSLNKWEQAHKEFQKKSEHLRHLLSIYIVRGREEGGGGRGV